MDNTEFFNKNYPGGCFSYKADESEEFVFVSPFLLHMLGYTIDEFKERTNNRFSNLIYPPDREGALRKINAEAPITEVNSFDSCSYRTMRKDGTLIWVHEEGHLVTLEDGTKLYFVVVIDISDYKGVLTAQSALISCIKILATAKNLDEEMNTVLESVFSYYQCSTCFISSIYDHSKKISTKYEL